MSVAPFSYGQGNPEANKLAREGSQASKDQDWDKSINLLKKATDIDNKYGAAFKPPVRWSE